TRASLKRETSCGGFPLLGIVDDARDQHGEVAVGRPFDDLETTVEMLDQSGAALHPIAVVAVMHAVDDAGFRLVDMAADHTVIAVAPRLGRHRGFEVADEL